MKSVKSLKEAFYSAIGFYSGETSLDEFLDFFDERALIVDDDHTSVLQKASFKDHLSFHLGSGMWESRALIAYEPVFKIIGDTGLITSNYTMRGKPVDSGFRLRHGVCSFSCFYTGEKNGWRAMSMFLGPMTSYIRNASPG